MQGTRAEPKLSYSSGPIVLRGVRTQTKSCDAPSGDAVLLLQEEFSGPFEGRVLLRSTPDIDEEAKQRKRQAKII